MTSDFFFSVFVTIVPFVISFFFYALQLPMAAAATAAFSATMYDQDLCINEAFLLRLSDITKD
jgi:hypothetical protein